MFVDIFEPLYGKHRGVTLKHWHGKRVRHHGKYVRIIAAQLDRNQNFCHWIISRKGQLNSTLTDPHYTAAVQKRIKNQLTSRKTLI